MILKNIALFLATVGLSCAQAQQEKASSHLDKDYFRSLTEIIYYGLKSDEKKKTEFAKLKTDECLVEYKNINNEAYLRQQNLRRCKDNSVSFLQPPSSGPLGYEGLCGQTTVSNLAYSYCKIVLHPKNYVDFYMQDLTPGARPDTLAAGLNMIFEKNGQHCPSGQWSAVNTDNANQFITLISNMLKIKKPWSITRKRKNSSMVKRNPIAALIRIPYNHGPHWVTVVDIKNVNDSKQCSIVFNSWDDQYESPCQQFAIWSKDLGETYAPILKPYTLTIFE